MRVMVALENRFLRTGNGDIYSSTVCNYGFWQRYLQVFDEVIVFARVGDVEQNEFSVQPANGPKVRFKSLPTFIGPWQYMLLRGKLRILAREAIDEADAFILRVPGTVSSLLWRSLSEHKMPYAVEVVGDPAEALSIANVRSVATPLARYVVIRNLRKQCNQANAAAYVTEKLLQQRYPCSCWNTFYSSIELSDSAIISENQLSERFVTLDEPFNGCRPYRICHIGTMEVLYKAQDTLIEAVSILRNRGINVESTLLGAGRNSDYFMEKARQMKVDAWVHFLGKLPPGAPVVEQLDMADLFVLPSATEGLPRVLIEAMARGIPCLGSDVGGIPELLQEDCLFRPRDPQALAAKIESTIQDKGRLERMGRRNVEKAGEFRVEELNKRRKELFRRIAEISRNVKSLI